MSEIVFENIALYVSFVVREVQPPSKATFCYCSVFSQCLKHVLREKAKHHDSNSCSLETKTASKNKKMIYHNNNEKISNN